jgi:hypothetical protein
MLVHGEEEPPSVKPPLDPRIVAGIDRNAEDIAEAYGNPLVGSFARDIMTDSAYVIIDTFGVDMEATSGSAETEATAELLTQGRGEPT